MKWMIFALLVCAVNGRPQIPACGEVTLSCRVDQVLIYDENSSQCACVDKVYENPENLDKSESRLERQLDEDDVDQPQKKPVVEGEPDQKPVPLPGQDVQEDPIRRQSSGDQVQKVGEVCKDPLHNPAKKRQGVEKPALAVDPAEVVKPVKPVKPVHPIQPEERPVEEEGPVVDVETKPAPEDQGNDRRRRRRQSEGEDPHEQVKPEDKPVEVVGQTRPLPLPSIEGQPGQTKPAPVIIESDHSRKQAVVKQDDPEVKPVANVDNQVPEGQVGVVETKPAPSEGQGDGNRRQADNEAQHPEVKPSVEAVPLPAVAVKPVDAAGEEVRPLPGQVDQPAAEESDQPAKPAGSEPVTIPAPSKRVARQDDHPQRQVAQRFRPQQRQDPFDFPDPVVPDEQRPDDSQVQPDQPVVSGGGPVAGPEFSLQPGNEFNVDLANDRQGGPEDDGDDDDVDAGNVELHKEGADLHHNVYQVDAQHFDEK